MWAAELVSFGTGAVQTALTQLDAPRTHGPACLQFSIFPLPRGSACQGLWGFLYRICVFFISYLG